MPIAIALAIYLSGYFSPAAAYAYKKDFDRVFQDYNQAIRLDPNYASAYTGRKAGSCDPNDGPKLLLSPRKV